MSSIPQRAVRPPILRTITRERFRERLYLAHSVFVTLWGVSDRTPTNSGVIKFSTDRGVFVVCSNGSGGRVLVVVGAVWPSGLLTRRIVCCGGTCSDDQHGQQQDRRHDNDSQSGV